MLAGIIRDLAAPSGNAGAVGQITSEYLASIIELRDGVMFWKHRGVPTFDRQYAGREVSLRTDRDGYHIIRVHRRAIPAHRAIWALHYGDWPNGPLDHIDGNRVGNDIANLRECDAATNSRNKGRQWNNTTGRAGVVRFGCKWRAQIVFDGAYLHLGLFDTFAEAAEARELAQRERGFTDRHGVRAATRNERGEGCNRQRPGNFAHTHTRPFALGRGANR